MGNAIASDSLHHRDENYYFTAIPLAIKLQILSHLSVSELLAASTVTKRWNYVANEGEVYLLSLNNLTKRWKKLHGADFGAVSEDYFRLKGLTWKQMYRTSWSKFHHKKQQPSTFVGRFFNLFSKNKSKSVLVLGLENAGKVKLT